MVAVSLICGQAADPSAVLRRPGVQYPQTTAHHDQYTAIDQLQRRGPA